MDSIVRWYQQNYTEITWFIIGWLSLDMLHEFSRGNYEGMAVDMILIILNYFLHKK